MAPAKQLANRKQRKGPVKVNVGFLANQNVNPNSENLALKRKAEGSPAQKINIKRSAFGDITNAIEGPGPVEQKNFVKKFTIKDGKIVPKITKVVSNHTTQASKLVRKNDTQKLKCKNEVKAVQIVQSEKSIDEGSSVYETAFEDSPDVKFLLEKKARTSRSSSESAKPTPIAVVKPQPRPPPGVTDIDFENWEDAVQVSYYAKDIFLYYKEREDKFALKDYIGEIQPVNTYMRAVLVDWMVEIQESFELNHETLYLAVYLMDMFLSQKSVSKETLQLIGAACIYIACKFDERMAPQVGDMVYICDGAYTGNDLLRTEILVLKTIGFDLGIPLSYRFLRRYGRCAKVSMETLTLARFILEMSLMEYNFILKRGSLTAAGAMLLALKMVNKGGWTQTLEYCSGYKLKDIRDVTHELNGMLHKRPRETLKTIRKKYSHQVFFEVAKLPLLDTLDI